MFTKEEASTLRREFWTTFGQYMKPIPSSEGLKINWVNYRTQVPKMEFKMVAERKEASIGIYLLHKEEGLREVLLEQLLEFKKLLSMELEEEWVWEEASFSPTRVYTSLSGVSIFNRDDWPSLFQFFKPRLIALDAFWENAKYVFQELTN